MCRASLKIDIFLCEGVGNSLKMLIYTHKLRFFEHFRLLTEQNL